MRGKWEIWKSKTTWESKRRSSEAPPSMVHSDLRQKSSGQSSWSSAQSEQEGRFIPGCKLSQRSVSSLDASSCSQTGKTHRFLNNTWISLCHIFKGSCRDLIQSLSPSGCHEIIIPLIKIKCRVGDKLFLCPKPPPRCRFLECRQQHNPNHTTSLTSGMKSQQSNIGCQNFDQLPH